MTSRLARVLVLSLFVSVPLIADVWDLSDLGISDDTSGQPNELAHGTVQVHDLGAKVGVADVDWYRVNLVPRTSWEATIGGFAGDIGLGVGQPAFERFTFPGPVLAQTKSQTSAQFTNFLRFKNDTAGFISTELRVSDATCGTTCTTNDQYTITLKETTVTVPRFNNSATQVTVLIMMNAGETSMTADAHFLTGTGPTEASVQTFTIASGETKVLNTSTIPALQGISGGITITHNGGYGQLSAKSVALEPATGFSFDTPGTVRP